MHNQEFFDLGVAHIIRQGGPALIDTFDECNDKNGDTCVYLDKRTNRSCLVGGVIVPLGLYLPEMETLGVDKWTEADSIMGEALQSVGLTSGQFEFVGRMQSCHDEAARSSSAIDFVGAFLDNVRHQAKVYNLDTSVIDRTIAEVAS